MPSRGRGRAHGRWRTVRLAQDARIRLLGPRCRPRFAALRGRFQGEGRTGEVHRLAVVGARDRDDRERVGAHLRRRQHDGEPRQVPVRDVDGGLLVRRRDRMFGVGDARAPGEPDQVGVRHGLARLGADRHGERNGLAGSARHALHRHRGGGLLGIPGGAIVDAAGRALLPCRLGRGGGRKREAGRQDGERNPQAPADFGMAEVPHRRSLGCRSLASALVQMQGVLIRAVNGNKWLEARSYELSGQNRAAEGIRLSIAARTAMQLNLLLQSRMTLQSMRQIMTKIIWVNSNKIRG